MSAEPAVQPEPTDASPAAVAAEATLSAASRFRRWAYGTLLIGNLERLCRALRHVPSWRPERHGVEVVRNVAYGDHPMQRLDVYVPPGGGEGLPVALYIHGGGFKYFSKDTHWALGSLLARRGYLTFLIDYRLVRHAPFPAAAQDACAGAAWVIEHAAEYGGDVSRMIWAGESAGANLTLAATIASCWPRPEPWATRLWDLDVRPKAVLPACGYLQISDPERHGRAKDLPAWMVDRIIQVSDQYVPDHRDPKPAHDFANVLTFLEAAPPPARPFPPCFTVCGTNDPVLGDSERLVPAVERHGAASGGRFFAGRGHAFEAVVFLDDAQRAWDDQRAFCAEQLGDRAPGRAG